MMLQVAMVSPASPTNAAAGYRRAAIVLGAVIAAHLVLLAIALSARNRIVERPVEPRTITASLLSPEPPAPVVSPPAPPPPAAVVPTAPTPPVTHPAVRVKPAPQPRAQVPRSVEKPVPTPSPTRESTAQPVTQAAVPSAASAPAVHPAVPASTEPRNVSHVDCSIPKPDYPDIAKRRGEHGTAIVRFVVGLSGHIETAQLQTSSGSARLDDAALAAVHAGACQPYTENGTPVRAAYSQSFVFGLTE
ncbi:protein TonB [Paraburkholderia sp. HC6.4b]|uniref:TonB family protein n=1 Tax=unclassified Paraburkholderia TaxID=2615204 RepID=UPI0017CDD6C1|nr:MULTISPECIES: TonB family protein [unclassified Paraburkholderia]MBB5410185.1 protein TonB [Paraburkholderia sp. HC6.4b]MBB5452394.1 protein TonB [Paraburkholderia sp. Kb1A]